MSVHKFTTKDSGKRREVATGSRRDTREGKGRFDLVPWEYICRIAGLYERGAAKYDDNNWKRGQPLSWFKDSGLRHAIQHFNGETDEDHMAAVCWNAFAYEWTRSEIKAGRLPRELDDVGAIP
jgi:hypothetical protein